MDGSLVGPLMSGISAVLTFVIVGLIFGWRRDRREAEDAKTKAHQAVEEAERKNQDLEMALKRAERESAAELRAQSAFDEERQARPSIELIEGPTEGTQGIAYTFRVRNRGKVFADAVTVWMVDAWGAELSQRCDLAQMIEPNEVAELTIQIREGAEPPLRVYSAWRDMSGLHQRESWVNVPMLNDAGGS